MKAFFTSVLIALNCIAIPVVLAVDQKQVSKQALEYHQQIFNIEGNRYEIKLPAGYRLELLNADLDGPRLLEFHANGDLFIGSKSGHIYRLQPSYTHAQTILELNDYPHSVAFRGNEILIAQTSGLYHAPYVAGQTRIDKSTVKLLAALPGGGGHNSRTVGVGPDQRIYVSLGITGNCSDEYLGNEYKFYDRRGGILVLDESKEEATWQTFGSGLRNPVGFDWHPQTGVMYASNNGPDHSGFEQPPEYFSRIEPGSFHGMPWFQFDGQKIKRDDCIQRTPPRPKQDVTIPVATFPARNAPMGVGFVPQTATDRSLQGDAVVALRGSWATAPGGGFFGANASRRHPKLVIVRFQSGEATGVEDLLTGFQLENGDRWARPVGVTVAGDGSIYFTSDSGINGLFRLRRESE